MLVVTYQSSGVGAGGLLPVHLRLLALGREYPLLHVFMWSSDLATVCSLWLWGHSPTGRSPALHVS